MEHIFLSVMTWHILENQGIRPSQQGLPFLFLEERQVLPDRPYFMATLDEGKAVIFVYLDFSEAFNRVCHRILPEKLAAHGMDRCSCYCVKNCLNGWAQIVLMALSSPSFNDITKRPLFWSVEKLTYLQVSQFCYCINSEY